MPSPTFTPKTTSQRLKSIPLVEKFLSSVRICTKRRQNLTHRWTSFQFRQFGIARDFFRQHRAKTDLKGRFYRQSFSTTAWQHTKIFQSQNGLLQHWRISNFFAGLYLLGATPACAKTTFAWQFMEQFAECGEICLFYSYEMAMLELFSKSYAGEIFKRDPSTNITVADIRNGAHSVHLAQIYSDITNRINEINLVDIDDIFHKLKTFQRETNITFIVISSFNRVNYCQQVFLRVSKNPETLNILPTLSGLIDSTTIMTATSTIIRRTIILNPQPWPTLKPIIKLKSPQTAGKNRVIPWRKQSGVSWSVCFLRRFRKWRLTEW